MELQKEQAKHWFNRAERETMLWSRKRKEMRNRADGNRISVQRQRLLNDCQLTITIAERKIDPHNR